MLASCSFEEPINANWPPHHPWENALQPSDSINVNLFLDASGSMRGFLAGGPDDRYLPVVEQLAGIATTGGWKTSQVKWWKFGAHVTEIPAKDRVEVRDPKFYSESTTQIDEVFRASNIKDLTVVVTDLFQSRADVDLLSSRLNERYLAGMRLTGTAGSAPVTPAVAVLGIETRFIGKVFELGEEGGRERSIIHNGTLPYYILVFGPLADVGQFLKRIDERFHDLLPHTRRVLFAERPVETLATQVDHGSMQVGFSFESNLMPRSSGGDKRVVQLQVPSLSGKKAEEADVIEPLLDCNLIHSGLNLDEKSLRAEVKGERPGANGSFEPDAGLAQALDVQSIKLEGNHLKLRLKLLRDQLRTGRDYRFEVRVFPTENAFQVPQSVLAWSLASNEVDQLVARQGFTPKGVGRTLNLAVFLQDLRDATFNGKQPPIGIVYFYVKAT
jgi:hypothetical protein